MNDYKFTQSEFTNCKRDVWVRTLNDLLISGKTIEQATEGANLAADAFDTKFRSEIIQPSE